jgi:hypothetical protein
MILFKLEAGKTEGTRLLTQGGATTDPLLGSQPTGKDRTCGPLLTDDKQKCQQL